MTPHPEAARSGRRCRPRYRSRSRHVKRRDGLPQVRGHCWWEAPGTPGWAQVRMSPREGGATGTGEAAGGQGTPVTGVWGRPGSGHGGGVPGAGCMAGRRRPRCHGGEGGVSPLPARGAPGPPAEPPPPSRRPRWSPRPRRCSAGGCWAWSTPRTSTPSSWPRKTCESRGKRPVGSPVPAPGASRDLWRAPSASPAQVGSVREDQRDAAQLQQPVERPHAADERALPAPHQDPGGDEEGPGQHLPEDPVGNGVGTGTGRLGGAWGC